MPARVDDAPTSDVAVRMATEGPAQVEPMREVTVHAGAATPGVAQDQRPRGDADECSARPDAQPATVAGQAAVELDREVTLAMRGMGFGAGETTRAMADSAGAPATTFEARLRAALAAWRTSRGSRCSEGPFDDATLRLTTALSLMTAPAEAMC